jgi:hypothetical protein
MTEAGARDVTPVSEEDAAAFRSRREALHAAVTDLDGHLDALDAQDVPDAARFRDALDELLGTLHRHVEEADAPDGLLAQILEEASYFASRVDRLRGEHEDLLARAGGLRDRAGATDDVRPLLPDARQLSARVAEHRQRGTALLVDATMLDLSAGD